ncbi:uncharacterized protein [Amphiura filiformis]|uniref:uncharacterized protein isoform X2 n=1 Tax=Amphiura filiformis TaxID=82378 RepID=UPI003B22122F
MSVTVTTKRYHKVKKERDNAHNKVDELTKELEQWQEKYENMEQERDAARMRQQELTKELRKLKGLSERETPLEAGSFKEEAGKTTPWLQGWKVKQLATLSMECLHQGQRSHDTRGSKASLVGLKSKPLEITVVNLSKKTKLEMASSYFHSGKFESEPVGLIEPGESHTYNVSSRDGRSKTGVKGGIAFTVSNVEGLEEAEPEEADEPAKENTAEEEKEQEEEKVENKEEDQKNVENGEVVKENKELDEDKELEKFDPPNGEKKEAEKKKKRFSLKREKKHPKHNHTEAPAEVKEEGEKTEEPAAEAAPEENATEEATGEEAKEETKEEATEEKPAEEEKPDESAAGKDEADSGEKKPKKKAKFSLRKHKKTKDTTATEPQEATKEEDKPAEEPQDQPDTAEPAEATEEKEPEAEPEATEVVAEHEEEKPEAVGNGAFFVCAFENPLAGIQKAKSSKTQSKDVVPVLKKMKSGSPSKQLYGGHYKDGKRHFVYIWKDPELGW